MTRIRVSDEGTGKSCPYCRFPLKSGSVAEQCDACSAIHHSDCWDEGGGCAVFGCANSSAPTVESEPAKTVAEPPSAAAAPSNPPSRVLMAAGGVLGALLLVLITLVAVKIADDPAPQPTAELAPETQAGDTQPQESVEPETEPDPAATSSERSRAKRDVAAVLSEYEDGYSTDDRSKLASTFTSGVTRTGQDSAGCNSATGRSEVLDALASNYGAISTYTLTQAGSSNVNLTENANGELTKASVNARYQVDGSAESFKIRLVLSNTDGDWQISKISSFCDGNSNPY